MLRNSKIIRQRIEDRDAKILSILAAGGGRREVAAALFITENTARIHIQTMKTRLGAKTVAHAVAIALASGIIKARARGE